MELLNTDCEGMFITDVAQQVDDRMDGIHLYF